MLQLHGDMKTTDKIDGYQVEKLCAGNMGDVEKLHTAVYGAKPAPNFFSAKYDTAFAGIRHVGFIAYTDQRAPIAFYAVIPCFIRFRDKVVLAAQSADTMTHPDFRNKGLFVNLADLTFQHCRNAGIRLVFGFPNQNSLPGFINKLGWQLTERMDCFIIRTAFPWKKIFGKFPFLKNGFAAYRKNLLKKYCIDKHGLENSVFDDGFAGVHRDHHFRKYKSYTDTCVIKIGEAELWVKVNGILLIGDLAVQPREFMEMMSQLKSLASALGIKEIHFHSSPGTTLHSLFAKNYTAVPSFPVIFRVLGEHERSENIKFTAADIDTF